MTIEGVDWGYELRPQSVKFGNKLDEVIGVINEGEIPLNFVKGTKIGHEVTFGKNHFINCIGIKISFKDVVISDVSKIVVYDQRNEYPIFTSTSTGTFTPKDIFIFFNQKIYNAWENSTIAASMNLGLGAKSLFAYGYISSTATPATKPLFTFTSVANLDFYLYDIDNNKVYADSVTVYESTVDFWFYLLYALNY